MRTYKLPDLSYGPWLPTNYLRWRRIPGGRQLEVKMRRRVKRFNPPGAGASISYEYEWQLVPDAVDD